MEVTADTANAKDKDAELFKKFDIVVATNYPKDELVRINSICRKEKVLFYAGNVFGFFGFSFMDLISHEYVEEVTQQVEQESDGADGEPTAKKQKTMEKETKSVKKAMTFVSLAGTLNVDWSTELYAKRIRNQTLEQLSVPTAKISDEMLSKLTGVHIEYYFNHSSDLLFAELSLVCAIVGGVLAQ